jgi:hypothetical protein
MDNTTIIGRKTECQLLKRTYNSGVNEFVVVYGRRRVGKSFLINKYFEGKFDFYMTGLYQKPKNFLLSTFAVALEEYSGKNRPVPKNWMTAMMQLKEYLVSLSKKTHFGLY